MGKRIGRVKGTLSLEKTIIRIVLVAYIILLILLVWMDYYLVRSYQNEIRMRESSAADKVFGEISESMEYVKRTLYDIYTNNEDFSALTKKADIGTAYSHAYDLRHTVTNQMQIDERWHAFYLFYNNNKDSLYYVNTNSMPAEDASRIYQALRQSVEAENGLQINSWGSLCIAENIYLMMGMKKGEATIYGLVSLTAAEELISEEASASVHLCLLENGTEVRYSDISGRLELPAYTANARSQFEETVRGNYVRGIKLDGSGIWGVAVYPMTWKDYVNLFQILLLLLTMFSCVAAVCIYLFLKKNMVQPLEDLRLKMEAIRRNSNNRFLTVNARFAELREVSETLDVMVEELEQQKLRTYEEYIEKQKAQMQFLQLQMKPHFYLNGLKALNALMLNGQTENVQELIFNLSEHFRYLLHQDQETTQLKTEIKFTENYCKIMDQMTGRNVHMEVNIPEEVSQFQIPVLAVQTFVENSIKYAKVGSVDTTLVITVNAYLLDTEEGKYLDLTVADNGMGYDLSVLRAINSQQAERGNHIGINNLKRRCRIMYGEKAEFTFRNQQGACSEIIIPEHTQEQNRE